MGFLNSKVVVEADCPNCDLIERHPLSAVRKAGVFTCRGCAHRYAASPSSPLPAAGGARENGASALRVAVDWIGPPRRRASIRGAFSLRFPPFEPDLLRPSWV